MTRQKALLISVLCFAFAFTATAAYAALTFSSTAVTSDGNMTLTVASDGTVTVGTGRLVLSPTFTGASSRQSVEADATLSSFTGSYGAGVMGNAMGTIGSGDSIVAGVIGKYSITDGTDTDHPQAGVVAEIGEDSANTADAAFLAVLGGDSGALTAGAAYGVRYLNSTAGSYFSYGLDLFSSAIDSYLAVSYNTADIRLQNGETISNGTNGTIAFGTANLTNTGSVTVTGNVDASTYITADSYRVTNNAALTAADVNLTKAQIQGASFFPVDTTSNAVDVDFGDDAALDAADVGTVKTFVVTVGGTNALTVTAGSAGVTTITTHNATTGTSAEDVGDMINCTVYATAKAACVVYAAD